MDELCEPMMAAAPAGGMLQTLFGVGKGSGAAMMMFILGVLGVAICLYFRGVLRKYMVKEQKGAASGNIPLQKLP